MPIHFPVRPGTVVRCDYNRGGAFGSRRTGVAETTEIGARACSTWDQFYRMMNRAFPKKGQTIELALGD
jgi:hypothetical protein